MTFWPQLSDFCIPWSAPTYLSCLEIFGCLGLACLNDPRYNEAESYEKVHHKENISLDKSELREADSHSDGEQLKHLTSAIILNVVYKNIQLTSVFCSEDFT